MNTKKKNKQVLKKLSHKVNKYLCDKMDLNAKIFKSLQTIGEIHSKKEYRLVKQLVSMYRKNETELNSEVQLYESKLEAYEFKHNKDKVNLRKEG